MTARVDYYPTESYQGYKLRPGRALPFGASLVPDGINFSVFSSHAHSCTLVLFDKGAKTPKVEIPFPESFRIGNVYAMIVFDLDPETLEYGYRMDGAFAPEQGHRFDPSCILMDPYAKAIGGRDVWGKEPDWNDIYQHRSRLAFDDFDWDGDTPLRLPPEDLIIYEAHVRSLSCHPSSGVKASQRGSFAAIRDKIPYLQRLGVNALELLPVFEFDEFEHSRPHPHSGERLMNYWGYSTVGFFAPKAGYAATGKLGMQVDEFKNLVKELHKAGIEIILDVVFNHTAEGNEKGPTFSFKGLDNKTYYMLTPEGYYYNFSGTGNTLNCNNPVVRNMVLDCLRYWAAEYHIDGFRFDLAAILGRDVFGAPLSNPPLLETLAFDPILAGCKLIAEAWDAGGLYQVGSFPSYGRWSEWNGKYRDTVRRFLKGDAEMVGDLAQRLAGSPDLYRERGATASINFITCHDGFTLHDLVAYNDKHNEANGEDNRDGANDNHSWNCGHEGPSDDPEINALRRRQIKNALTMLFVSQGVPLLLMGDEMGHSQQGNNNTYCHDSPLTWLDWGLLEQNADIFRFTQGLIAFRKAHPLLRNRWHFSEQDYLGTGLPDLSWHGRSAWQADFSAESRYLAMLLCGRHSHGGQRPDNSIYAAFNSDWQAHGFELPQLPHGEQWHIVVNTGAAAGQDIHIDQPPRLEPQSHVLLGARSAVVLIGKEA